MAAGAAASDVLATGVPSQVTGGFATGFAAGYSAKKIGKVATFVFGTGFCIMQYLSYNGYIAVDYDEVGRDLGRIM